VDNEKLSGLSMDIEATELDKLHAIFPRCFTDGKLDISKLLEACGEFETVDENDRERYEFRWKGKQESLQLAGKRSAGTLRPCRSESVNWDETQNLYIEGDNLEVLKLLQTAYYRKVKMIYIDPPYNTGNDFVYQDDFADPLARYREVTQQTTKSNPEAMGRFHTNWLNMMYPRLRLAANLLRDDGAIFISIDDNEVHNLRKLCDEVFGEENFIAQIIWEGANKNDARQIGSVHEYVLVYAKNRVSTERDWSIKKDGAGPVFAEIARLKDKYGDDYSSASVDLASWFISMKATPSFGLRRFRKIDEKGAYKEDDPTAPGGRRFDLVNPQTGCIIPLRPKRGWSFDQETFNQLVDDNRVVFVSDKSVMIKRYLHETDKITPPSVMYQPARSASERLERMMGSKCFEFPKDETVIRKFLEMCTEKDDIILDFFSGSATTAHAVMQLNAEDGGHRHFIMVQLPELCDEKLEAAKAGYSNICEIGKERIRRAGAKIAAEQSGQAEIGEEEKAHVDIGFRVFKLDTSNLKLWDDSPIIGDNAVAELKARIEGMLDIIKPDRSEMDVVYEVMLKLGQELSIPVLPLDINGKTVYGVGAEVKFIVCLAHGITPEDAEAMAEYAPGRIIFADACFDNSEQKSNVRLTLKDKGIAIKAL